MINEQITGMEQVYSIKHCNSFGDSKGFVKGVIKSVNCSTFRYCAILVTVVHEGRKKQLWIKIAN